MKKKTITKSTKCVEKVEKKKRLFAYIHILSVNFGALF